MLPPTSTRTSIAATLRSLAYSALGATLMHPRPLAPWALPRLRPYRSKHWKSRMYEIEISAEAAGDTVTFYAEALRRPTAPPATGEAPQVLSSCPPLPTCCWASRPDLSRACSDHSLLLLCRHSNAERSTVPRGQGSILKSVISAAGVGGARPHYAICQRVRRHVDGASRAYPCP